jgi:hypothetical protein
MIAYVFGQFPHTECPMFEAIASGIQDEVFMNIDTAIEYMRKAIADDSASALFENVSLISVPEPSDLRDTLMSIPMGSHAVYCDSGSTTRYVKVVRVVAH